MKLIAMTAAIGLGLILMAQETDPDAVRYDNAHVWTGTRFEPMSFAVSDGRFVDPARAGQQVDLAGRFIVPPFGEGHTHKFETPWSVNSFSAQMFEQGVFYARNPGAYAPNVQLIRDAVARTDTVDVSFAMGGLTTPHGHPEGAYINVMTQFWYQGFSREDFIGRAFHPVLNADEAETALDTLEEQGADFVKIFLQNSDSYAERAALLADPDYRAGRGYPDYRSITGLDPALVPGIVASAHRRGLTVSAHVSNAADFEIAVRAGVDEINHMPGASWEDGYTLDSQLPSREIAALAAAQDIPVVATAAVRLGGIPPEHADLVNTTHLAILNRLRDAGVTVLIGTDNYGQTTRDEINYLRQLGVFDDGALISAWIETGQRIFPDRQIGVIAEGYEASYLVLDANPLEDFSTLDRIVDRVKQGERIILEE